MKRAAITAVALAAVIGCREPAPIVNVATAGPASAAAPEPRDASDPPAPRKPATFEPVALPDLVDGFSNETRFARTFGAPDGLGLDALCTTVQGGECEVYRRLGVVRVLTASYANEARTRFVRVILS